MRRPDYPDYKFFITTVLLSIILIRYIFAQGSGNMPAIQLACVQMNVTGNISENKAQILQSIRQASTAKVDFLVTPEGSLSGYTSHFNQQELDLALLEIIEASRNAHVGLMLGTCFKIMSGQGEFCYNQVRVYDPEGVFMGAYCKILRCSPIDYPGTGEMTDYVEGELKTFSWHGQKFGILICNDLWASPGYTTIPNPYLPWKLKQMGASFIVHCINSGTDQRYRPFHESSAELWALSLEIPILEINAAQDQETINAQSGLIEASGNRTQRVPDAGTQFFTVEIPRLAEGSR